VTECALTAKKYMLPLFALHPYIAGALVAGYVGHGRFNLSRNALILDSQQQLDAPLTRLTRMDRRAVQDRFEELLRTESWAAAADDPHWASLHAAAEPAFDASGEPTLKVRLSGEVTPVGIARANILSVPQGFEFAAGLVKARLREELKSAAARKTARADVESDLLLLQQLLARPPGELGSTAASATTAALSPRQSAP
jgi:hypothetical protein